jgi:hypothetical protein
LSILFSNTVVVSPTAIEDEFVLLSTAIEEEYCSIKPNLYLKFSNLV